MLTNKIFIHAPGGTQEHEFDTDQNSVGNNMPHVITNICAMGAGGGGGNILTDIAKRGMQNIDFAATNTDHPTLRNIHSSIKKYYIGGGKGAGAYPEVARRAAEQCEKDFIDFLTGRDLFFVTACLGKGTGSGVAPFLCELGRKLGILTVAIVAKGFSREGKCMEDNFNYALERIEKNANAIFVVENDIILKNFPKETSIDAINRANDSLYTTMRVINSIIQTQSFIKADFSDIERCLTDIGYFMAGIGESADDNDAGTKAVEQALGSCFYENYELRSIGQSIMQTTYSNKYNQLHVDQAFDTLRGRARGDKAFGIIPAENPIDDMKNFRVEFIAPLQKKPVNTWNEKDAIIEIIDKNTANGNIKPPKHNPKLGTEFDTKNLLDLPIDNNTNISKGYTKGGISIISKSDANKLEPITPIKITSLSDINGRPRGSEELNEFETPAWVRNEKIKYNAPSQEVPTEKDELLRLAKLLNETNDPDIKKGLAAILMEKKIQTEDDD